MPLTFIPLAHSSWVWGKLRRKKKKEEEEERKELKQFFLWGNSFCLPGILMESIGLTLALVKGINYAKVFQKLLWWHVVIHFLFFLRNHL